MTIHRYWRLEILAPRFSGPSANDDANSIAEIEFHTSVGGANVLAGGTASASSISSSTYPASAAVDGNVSTFWVSQDNPISYAAENTWWGYDFGAGNGIAGVAELKITPRNDAYYYETVTSGQIAYSDDGTNWFGYGVLATPATWASGVAQTLAVTAYAGYDGTTAYADWRVFMDGNDGDPNDNTAIAELEFHSTVGGANIISGGTATASSDYSGTSVPLAIDGNITTFWASNAQPCWYEYAFASPVVVLEVKITTRDDTYYLQGPGNVHLQYYNGTAWIDATVWENISWTSAGQAQTFDVVPSAAPAVVPWVGPRAHREDAYLLRIDYTAAPLPRDAFVGQIVPPQPAHTHGNIISMRQTTASAVNIYLPADPIVGKLYVVKDSLGVAAGTPFTLATRDGTLIDGAATLVLDAAEGCYGVLFDGDEWISLWLNYGKVLPVNHGGTGTVTYTSGGVVYASASGTLASSAALGANDFVMGGGAGAAPYSSAILSLNPVSGLLQYTGNNMTTPQPGVFSLDGADANQVYMAIKSAGNVANTQFPAIYMIATGGTQAAPAATPSGQILYQLAAQGYGAGAYNGAILYATTSSLWSSTNGGTYLSFLATPDGTQSIAEVLRLQEGVTVPSTVAGGDKGAGTVNVSVGYYKSGVNVTPGQLAVHQSNPANPTGVTGVTPLMQGLAGSITPVFTGRVLFQISGSFSRSSSAGWGGAILYYGTGTAPANGAAVSGTEVSVCFDGGDTYAPFTLQSLVAGLAAGVTYWYDLALQNQNSADVTSIINASLTAYEL